MRVWDAFLSERDKAHTEAFWAKQEAFGLGTRPVLLVIDNIYGILGPRRDLMDAAGAFPASCGLEGWDAIDHTVELIAAARESGIPIAFATLRSDMPSKRGGRRTSPDPASYPADVAAEYSELARRYYDIVDELRPQASDFVVTKTSASMFAGTELRYFLTALDADTVICCGNSTSGCVRATVVDAAANRLSVGLVEECTFDRTQASHAMSLYDMEQKYADVMSLADTKAYFASVATRELVPA